MERPDLTSGMCNSLFGAGFCCGVPACLLPPTSDVREPLFIVAGLLVLMGVVGWIALWLKAAPLPPPTPAAQVREAVPPPSMRSQPPRLNAEATSTGIAEVAANESTPFPAVHFPGRVVLGPTISPAFLMNKLGEATDLQRENAIQTYKGKWLRVSGTIIDVSRVLDRFSMSIELTGRNTGSVYMLFDGHEDQLSALHRGEIVHAIGRIQEIERSSIKLNSAELVIA